MTLIEFSNDSYWRAQEHLERFFKTNPKFKHAEIISEEIDYNFPCDYDYSYSWLVKIKDRFYNVIISEGGAFRKSPKGVKFCRYYTEGEQPVRKRRNTSWSYINTKTAVASTTKYRNDCQIWTLAKCLNIAYDDAHNLLSKNGWLETDAGNIWTRNWKDIFEQYGYLMTELFSKFMSSNKKPFKGSIVGNINQKLPKVGTFIVLTSSHVLCVIDGVIYDSCFEPTRHVGYVYQINKTV